jgi:hypothetical protein
MEPQITEFATENAERAETRTGIAIDFLCVLSDLRAVTVFCAAINVNDQKNSR